MYQTLNAELVHCVWIDLRDTSLNIPPDFIIEDHHRVCNQHFLYNDKTNRNPTLQGDIGVRFGSPQKWPALSRLSPRKQLKTLWRRTRLRSQQKRLIGKVLWRVWVQRIRSWRQQWYQLLVWTSSIDGIKGNDKWVPFYTGFQSYAVFQAFYQFLLPAAVNLNYYRSESAEVMRIRKADKVGEWKCLMCTPVSCITFLFHSVWLLSMSIKGKFAAMILRT